MNQRMPDYDVTEAMIAYGGGFMKTLGLLYCQGDQDNKRCIKATWPEYWQQYDDLAVLKAGQKGEKSER